MMIPHGEPHGDVSHIVNRLPLLLKETAFDKTDGMHPLIQHPCYEVHPLVLLCGPNCTLVSKAP